MRFSKVIISVMSMAAVVTVAGPLNVNAATTQASKVTAVKTSYNSKKHAVTIKGRANVAKLALQYKGKKVANVKVKSGKFSVTKAFKGYGAFKLVHGTKNLKTISSAKYATPRINLVSAERTTKGMHYKITGPKNAKLVIARKGKTIKTVKTAKTTTKVYLKNALIKNSSKHLTMTQRTSNKKTSRAYTLPALKVGVKQVINTDDVLLN
ncbi:hypothetical protein [Lactiplantibacillus paraxiangfangensis]|uniref:hypothetical protein n=1 Tax=Lactiplantibacillus paraxiangfangensis TaxID=3076224 RepID=UPI0030C68098